MKTNTIAKTLTIAAVTAFALCIAPGANAADKGCSAVSLTGTFAYTVTGSFVAAPAPLGPYAEAGTQKTFDGKGGTTVAGGCEHQRKRHAGSHHGHLHGKR